MELMDYLNSAKKNLFRFEYLQDFSGTDTQFLEWQKTHVINEASIKSWWDFLEKKHAEGVATARVRLLMLPPSEYSVFELEVHRETAQHGDNIRIITDDVFKTLAIPFKDFWMIDDQTVLRMIYGERGVFKGIELIEGDVEEYRKAKKELIGNSHPIAR